MKLRSVFLNTTLIASALFGASALQAQEIENTGNIYIGGVGYFADSDRNIDDDIGTIDEIIRADEQARSILERLGGGG